jgi:predicted Zn-dependent protease with MMP-like domain/Flp pilus assembly protein TadD
MNGDPRASDICDRVRALIEEGRLEEAERLGEERPGSAEARLLVGIARAEREDFEGALAAFDEALALDPGLADARLSKARVLYEDGRFEDVLETLEGEDSVEGLFLVASALYELGEHEESESVCARAMGIAELPELRHLEALLLLQRAEREKASVSARRTVELDPELADGHHVLGLALTQLGRIEEADSAFARAADLEPESCFRPPRLTPEQFDEVVDEAIEELPEEFQEYLENVEVGVVDVPDPELIREGIEFDLLGLYHGTTIQSVEWGFPDRVMLFQRNLENVSPDRETLVREIRDTVYHEIGHHMGMDEDAVQRAEEGEED